MPFRFSRKDKSVETALRRIACEEVDAALAEIGDPTADPHETVHQVRKRAKRLRGLIRLVRPGFSNFAGENAAIRDAARQLSALRDRAGMLETFDKLIAAHGNPDAAARFAPLRSWLTEGQEAATDSSTLPASLAGFGGELDALRQRTKDWSLDGAGFDALKPGLVKTYARGRAAMRAFAGDPTDANTHEWRKRVKYHWYHTRLLSPARPGPMKTHARLARDLGELLGDRHDLHVLETAITESAAQPGTDDLREAFLAVVARRREEMTADALALGHRLYAEKPNALARRWKDWWKAWKPRAA